MKLLAFETATEACSVALWIDGDVRERFEIAPRRHAELALPWAEQLLVEAGIARTQLDVIAVGRGPGAFTGVRLAIAIAQGIALALDLPVVPVSTLAALAASLPSLSLHGSEATRILAAIDARMGEIYLGSFMRDDSGLTALSDECVVKPDAAIVIDGHWHGVGTGFSAADNALQRHLQLQLVSVDSTALPHAADVARLAAIAFSQGKAMGPEFIAPAYLRNNVALTLVQQHALRNKS
ncbi:MAG: tRNA (adenosine(37)-N6)-threonylcarbamoyltransferase complex dimerization subunit type 1 TsaB [Luteimonas sp.]